METQEQCVDSVNSYQKRHQNEVNDVDMVSLLLAWTDFTPFSSVFVVNFEQVNVSWAATLPCLDSDESIFVNIPPLVGCSVLCEEPGRW